MAFKRLIVLANSYKKYPGRCVAGRELGADNIVGNWVRPISDQTGGELLPHHMRTDDGLPLEVLDTMDVPLIEHAKDLIHPEDWRADPNEPWKRQTKFDAKRLSEFEESPSDLWLDPATRADRATPEFLRLGLKHQSLYLIHPTDFCVELTNDFNPFEGRNQPKRRACFTYQGQKYSLGLTDPVFIDQYALKFPEPDQTPNIVRPTFGDKCLLCVSLTPLFNDYHFKVVATVLRLP